MTQETLLKIGKLGLAIEDRSHYAGYTELYKLPGMKDIADDAAEYIKNRLGEVIDEHCKSLEACISALGNTVTAKADKPDRKANTQLRNKMTRMDSIVQNAAAIFLHLR